MPCPPPRARRGVFERDYQIDASPIKVRFAFDSPLEEGVRSELVSES
jgi:hypothetical protein